MCFSIKKEPFNYDNDRYHKNANTDIEVFKLGMPNENCFNPEFKKTFTYEINKITEFVYLKIENNDQYICINEGYYSYLMSSLYCITGLLLTYSYKHEDVIIQFIGKFIIPKDTEYYIDNYGEIVSTQLKYTGKFISKNDFCKVWEAHYNTNKKIDDIWHS